MKELFKKHYQAIVNRGLITNKTTLVDFAKKIYEEKDELSAELNMNKFKIKISEDNVLSSPAKQESIDLICATMNMLIHYGIDIEKELIENIKLQEKRANNISTIKPKAN